MEPTTPPVKRLRRKAPQLVAIAIVLIIALYVLFELVEDVVIEGAPLTSGPLISAIIHLTSDVTATVSSWGYGGVFALMILESSSLPVPSEVVLPFAGFLISSGRGNFDFWITVFVATIAAIIGSLIDYYIGLRGIEALAKRRFLGRVIFSTEQLTFAARWFQKYGSAAVFLARLVPVLRTFISFPAGAAKMPVPKFLAFTTAGCLIWNSLLIYVGYFLGSRWKEVAGFFHNIILGVIAVFLILIAGYLFMRRRRKRS